MPLGGAGGRAGVELGRNHADRLVGAAGKLVQGVGNTIIVRRRWTVRPSIEVQSGRIVIAGCTDYFPEAKRLEVRPGTYRARIYYGDLDTLSQDGLAGNDHYRVVLWPSPPDNITVLK